MRVLGNILWLLLGGLLIAIAYVITSLVLFITIIGIPFGLQTIKMAELTLWPFGREVRNTEESAGCLTTLMNIIWILVGGFWICIAHFVLGLILGITIIGIPFATQHFKLAALSLTPFGKVIVPKD